MENLKKRFCNALARIFEVWRWGVYLLCAFFATTIFIFWSGGYWMNTQHRLSDAKIYTAELDAGVDRVLEGSRPIAGLINAARFSKGADDPASDDRWWRPLPGFEGLFEVRDATPPAGAELTQAWPPDATPVLGETMRLRLLRVLAPSGDKQPRDLVARRLAGLGTGGPDGDGAASEALVTGLLVEVADADGAAFSPVLALTLRPPRDEAPILAVEVLALGPKELPGRSHDLGNLAGRSAEFGLPPGALAEAQAGEPSALTGGPIRPLGLLPLLSFQRPDIFWCLGIRPVRLQGDEASVARAVADRLQEELRRRSELPLPGGVQPRATPTEDQRAVLADAVATILRLTLRRELTGERAGSGVAQVEAARSPLGHPYGMRVRVREAVPAVSFSFGFGLWFQRVLNGSDHWGIIQFGIITLFAAGTLWWVVSLSKKLRDLSRRDLEFGQFIGFALPSAGFVGTVIGVGAAPGRIGDVLVKDPVLQQQALRDMGASLTTAFDTTLVALVLSLVFALLLHVMRWHVQSRGSSA